MILGLVVGVFLSALVLRATDWNTVVTTARDADPVLIVLSVIIGIYIWVARSLRYQLLLLPKNHALRWPYFCSVTISEFVDVAIPFRLGIPVRAFVLNRLTGIPFMRGAAATVLDRLMDFFAILFMVLVSVFLILPFGEDLHFPADLISSGQPVVIPGRAIAAVAAMFSLLVAAVTGGVFLVWALRDHYTPILSGLLNRISRPLSERVSRAVTAFALQLNAFESIGQIIALVIINVFIWAATWVSMLTVFMAFGLQIPFYGPILILACIMFSTILLPNPPGYIGLYHAAIIVALSLVAPDVSIAKVSAVAIHLHLLHMGLCSAVGCSCIVVSHLSIRDLSEAEALGQAPLPESPHAGEDSV